MDIFVPPSITEIFNKGFLSIPYFTRAVLEEDIHPEQEKFLDDIRSKFMSLVECSLTTGNRWGKGDFIKILFAWFSTYRPIDPKFKDKPLSILNTSISQDQANIVFDKFESSLMEKKLWSWLIKDVKKSPFPHIIFKTGITWWFRNASQNGKFLEGRNYALANFDEADLQTDFPNFIEDIMAPRLWDVGGRLLWSTTPRRGKRNAFKQWNALETKIKAGNSSAYLALRGDSRNNTFLSPVAIDRMNALPDRLKNKNVLGIYDDTEGAISYEALDFCEMIADGLTDYPIPGKKYVSTYDFARSTTFNVGVTVELGSPLQLRSIERRQDPGKRNREYWQLIAKSVRDRHKKWRGALGMDITGLGDVLSSFLSDVPHTPFNFGLGHGSLRNEIIETGISVISCGEIGIPLSDPRLNVVMRGELWSARDELLDFTPDALDHVNWDFVCALFMAIFIAKGHKVKRGKSASMPNSSIACIKGVNRYAVLS